MSKALMTPYVCFAKRTYCECAAKLLKNMLSATEERDFLDIFYSSISESEWNTLWVKLLMVSMGA